MKKLTAEEQRIYQIMMMDIRADWRVLIGYVKERNNATSSAEFDSKDYGADIEYLTIRTLYRTLRSIFGIDTNEMQERLSNYRYYGRCVK